MMTQQIADTIKAQLGGKAIAMLGAKNFGWTHDGLTFEIRGCREVSHIRINLRNDLYDIIFLKAGIRGRGVNRRHYCDKVAMFVGLGSDKIHEVIERVTGLRTSL